MADQSEDILIYTCQESSRGVVTGIATDDWTVAEKTRQKPSPVASVAARNGALRAIVIIAGLLISAGTAKHGHEAWARCRRVRKQLLAAMRAPAPRRADEEHAGDPARRP
jgi:hypothetical protein